MEHQEFLELMDNIYREEIQKALDLGKGILSDKKILSLMEQLHKEELMIAKTKGIEYTQGDRLDNFYRIGTELGINPKIVLWVYLKKHLDSIARYIKTNEVLSEPIEGRIMDARIYLMLLRGLVQEEQVLVHE